MSSSEPLVISLLDRLLKKGHTVKHTSGLVTITIKNIVDTWDEVERRVIRDGVIDNETLRVPVCRIGGPSNAGSTVFVTKTHDDLEKMRLFKDGGCWMFA